MAHLHRFYIPPESPGADTIRLTGEEAHHLIHVVRAQVGDSVEVFNGAGVVWQCRVAEVSRRDAVLAVEAVTDEAPPTETLVLLQAYLGRDKSMETLVQRGAELGVDRFVFFPGDHSQRARPAERKWRRWAIESCKQCRRNHLPRFETAANLGDAFARVAGQVLWADLQAEPVPLRAVVAGDRPLALLIGPEGDFSPIEQERARAAGAVPISFGNAVLRAEAAAIAGIALIRYELGGLGPLP